MPNPWVRPDLGSPFRNGDCDSDTLYLAVGKALSSWERLEGEIARLYAAIIGVDDKYYLSQPIIRAFGTPNSPATRADMVAVAAASTFYSLGFQSGLEPAQLPERDGVDALSAELREILKSYRGWMARRNDVAHGCVTTREIDGGANAKPEVFHLLFPSDGNAAKWCEILGEPDYAYEAQQIDDFCAAFDNLRVRVSAFADRVSTFRRALNENLEASQFSEARSVSP